MTSYTNNTPQASDQISTTQPLILNNFGFLQTAINQEHNFVTSSPTSTYHKQASMPNRSGGDPGSLPAGTNGMYYVTGANARFYDGTNISRLTEGSPAQNGYQWLGRVLIQWGIVTKNPNSPASRGSVTFPISFPKTTFNVQTTPFSLTDPTPPTNVGPGDSATASIYAGSSIPLNTGFQFWFYSNSSQYKGFYWVAIGN